MGYFDNIETKNKNISSINEPKKSEYVSMMERVEKRAYEILQPTQKEMTETATLDPFSDCSPNDSEIWMHILFIARDIDYELYARLWYIRGGGTRLVTSQKWGYIMQPVVRSNNHGGWDSLQQYEKEKHCLDAYIQTVIKLMKDAAQWGGTGK